MRIITNEPLNRLKPFIKQMWVIEEGGRSDVVVKSFPVGYSFINVIDGNPFTIEQGDVSTEHKSYLAGPKSSHFNLKMSHIKRALTIQLQPYAVPSLLSIPSNEFYGQVLPVRDFNPPLAERLEELVASDLTSENVLESTRSLFIDQLDDHQLDLRLPEALSLIMRSKGNMPIVEVAHALNLSPRRLQQLFQYYFGMTAKSYSRVAKMQYHTFEWLKGQSLDTAIPDGYYDQSHFIHELKKQTGMLPKTFYSYINDDRTKQAYINSNLYYTPPLLQKSMS